MAKKKKKRKIPLRTQIRRMAGKAHAAMSLYVRELTRREFGGKCPLCGRGPLIPNKPTRRDPRTEVPAIQCVFHFIRSKFSRWLRYDVRNVVGACHTCNWREYRHPDPSRAWFIRERGVELYLQLVDESENEIEYTLEYLTKVRDSYERLLAELLPEELKCVVTTTDAAPNILSVPSIAVPTSPATGSTTTTTGPAPSR